MPTADPVPGLPLPGTCPVCGRAGDSRETCRECGWTLRVARKLGPVTEETRAEFDRQLAGARRNFDARAAALVSADPDRLATWIRGGRPCPEEWSAAVRGAADRTDRAVGEAAVIAAISTRLRGLRDADAITIAEVGPEGVGVTRVSTDKSGAPRLRPGQPVMAWPELAPMLSAHEDERRFQLAGGLAGLDRGRLDKSLADVARQVSEHARAGGGDAGDEVLVLCQPAGWQLLEDLAKLLVAGAGRARLARITGLPAKGNGLLSTFPDRAPLLRGYGVVVAVIAPASGAVTIETRPLFDPGDSRGKESVLTFRRVPGDGGTTTLAVAITGYPAAPAARSGTRLNGAALEVVSLHSVPLPDEAVYSVRAVLDAPGQVRITEPRGSTRLTRPWREVLAGIPDRVDVRDGPVDLVCALELGGSKAAVDRRRDLIRDLLEYLATVHPGDGERLRVGILGCTDHVFAPGQQEQRVVRRAPLGALASAQTALARFQGVNIQYPDAAPLEDLLHVAQGMLAESQAAGRAGRLLLVAGRRAHPKKLTNLVHPCPFHCDWRELARALAQSRVPVVAVVDAMPGRAAKTEFWSQVAPAGVHGLGDVSAGEVAADLGLTVRPQQCIGIPLAG
jgi:hypothetical protein